MPSRKLYLIQSEHHHCGVTPVIIRTHRLETLLDARLTLIRVIGQTLPRLGYFHDSLIEKEIPRWENILRYGVDIGGVPEEELPNLAEQLRRGSNSREAYHRLAMERYISGNYPDYDLTCTIATLSRLQSAGTDIVFRPTEKYHAVTGQSELRKLLDQTARNAIRNAPTRAKRSKTLFREIIEVRSAFIIDNIIEFAEDTNIAFLGMDHSLMDLDTIPNMKTYRVLIELVPNGEDIILRGELPQKFSRKMPSKTDGGIPIDDAIEYVTV